MGASRFERIQELFDAAFAAAEEERKRLLEEQRSVDPSIADEVERLLSVSNQELDGFLDRPPGADGNLHLAFDASNAEAADSKDDSPARIGKYRIVRRIGEGGMGIVFEAVQDEPRRTVALKVIRSASTLALRRFQLEADVLAVLRHAGIAHVYEVGVAEVESRHGVIEQAYFAMEYIDGEPLDEYARTRSLSSIHRLELVARICDAVEHAHQKGVIHRDLKPSNILVSHEGLVRDDSAADHSFTAQPKIIDFGVARVVTESLRSETLETREGQILGTLRYMSPEQISGDGREVDTRSDVYALGVVLHEILTDRSPYDLRNSSLPEAARIISEVDPPSIGAIDAQFRGDVETIVGKALAKHPDERYQSAADLSSDIRRHLRDEPILGRPMSTTYQVYKFAKRNKALLGGVFATFLTLVLGLIVAIVLSIREAEQRQLASEGEQRALSLAYRTSLTAASVLLDAGNVLGARESLEQASPELRRWEWFHLKAQVDGSVARRNLGERVPHHAHLWRDRVELLIADSHATAHESAGRLMRWNPSSGTLALADKTATETKGHLAVSPNGLLSAWLTDGTLVTRRVSAETADDETRSFDTANWGLPQGWAPQAIAISNDGRFLAALYQAPRKRLAHLVRIDLSSETPIFSQFRKPLSSRIVALSPSGLIAAALLLENGLIVWNPETESVLRIDGPTKPVTAVAFNPDGGHIATASQDGAVRLFDSSNGDLLATGRGHNSGVLCIAIGSRGHVIASGDAQGTVQLWKARATEDRTFVNYGQLRGHTDAVGSLAFSPDDEQLVTTSLDHSIRVWNVPASDPFKLQPFQQKIDSIAFSPDGSRLLCAAKNGVGKRATGLCLVDTASGDTIAQRRLPGTGVRNLDFSRDGSFILAATSNAIHILNPATMNTERVIDGQLFSAAFLGDSKDVLSLSQNDVIRWNSTTGEQKQTWTAPKVNSSDLVSLVPSPDGTRLAGRASGHGTVRVFDAATLEPIIDLESECNVLLGLSWNAKGTQLVAAAGRPACAVVWNLTDPTPIAVLRGHTNAIQSAVFAPSGKRIIATGDRALRFWDAQTFEPLLDLQRPVDDRLMAFSPDGSQLAVSDGSGALSFLTATTLSERVHTKRDRQDRMIAVAGRVQELFSEYQSWPTVIARLKESNLTPADRRAAVDLALLEALGEATMK